MHYDRVAGLHHAWVEAMGWHNRTHLEAFGMICSEVGEAAAELTPSGFTDRLASEIADIALRCLDQAMVLGLKIDFERAHCPGDRPRYRTLKECLLQMTIELAGGINGARGGVSDIMAVSLIRTLMLCEEACEAADASLATELDNKIAMNRAKGHRGRTI